MFKAFIPVFINRYGIPLPLYPCIPVSLYPYIPVSLYPCIPVSLYPCIPESLYSCFLYPCIPVSLYSRNSAKHGLQTSEARNGMGSMNSFLMYCGDNRVQKLRKTLLRPQTQRPEIRFVSTCMYILHAWPTYPSLFLSFYTLHY